jgi:hypothetical protein
VPRGEDHHRSEHRGEQHQRQPDPVHAERVVGAEDADPLGLLGVLEAAADVVPEAHHRGDRQRDQRDAEGDLLGQDAVTATR